MTPSSPPTAHHGGSRSRMSVHRILIITFGLSVVALWNNLRHLPEASSENARILTRRASEHVPLELRADNFRNMRRAATLKTSTNVAHSNENVIIPAIFNTSIKTRTASSELGANKRRNNNKTNFFSACLLTKDDSHFLIEWIAYHYHTLPLRHLIVAVDPDSKTTPSPIFAKWRQNGAMRIDEWTDTDFMKESKANQTSINVHRSRQKAFYRQCLKTLKNANRTYTILIDVDEYLSFNTHTENITVSLETPGAFLPFLQQEMAKDENESQLYSHSPCIMMPRVRYGSVESTAEQVSRDVPVGFNGTAFQTLRYRKHGPPFQKRLHGAGKTIIDVSRIRNEHIKSGNPHRPVKICTKEVFLKPDKSPLIVRHYLGSMEQFLFRDDARQAKIGKEAGGMKSIQAYDRFKDLDNGADDAVRPWLKGFVDDIGYDAAMDLLEGVGDVSIAPPMPKRQ